LRQWHPRHPCGDRNGKAGWLAAFGCCGTKAAFQPELNKIAGQKDGIVLVLQPEQVLRKKLSLPLAAEENLRQVIAFEMDRLTPFKVEQVYFDCRRARRDKQLEVSLVVVPRATIDEPLRQLAVWGAQVAAVLVADEAADGITWNLLPEGQRQKGRNTGLLRLNIALASGAMVLLSVVLALPVWQKREALQALHPLLDKTHQQAVEAENLRASSKRCWPIQLPARQNANHPRGGRAGRCHPRSAG
jgi:general secretion pathway protein L